MKAEIEKHNQEALQTCKTEQGRFDARYLQVRSAQRIRAAMMVLIVAVILIIAWAIAGIMKDKALFIVAGVATGLALLSLVQLVPFRLGYTRVDEGYVVTSCFQFLRKCNYIPDAHKGKPVIGITGAIFKDQKRMYYISLPASLTHIGNECFMNCKDLRGVIFRGDAELKVIGDKAFFGCVNLYAFCAGDEVRKIGENAFENCRSLRCAYFGGGVEKVGHHAFASCGNLASMSAFAALTELPRGTFSGCRSLQTMPLPGTLEKIDDDCFGYCASLTGIDIPDKVAYIGRGAFADCRALTQAVIRSKPEFIGNNAFRNCDKTVITFTAVKKQSKDWNGQWADKRCTIEYAR